MGAARPSGGAAERGEQRAALLRCHEPLPPGHRLPGAVLPFGSPARCGCRGAAGCWVNRLGGEKPAASGSLDKGSSSGCLWRQGSWAAWPAALAGVTGRCGGGSGHALGSCRTSASGLGPGCRPARAFSAALGSRFPPGRQRRALLPAEAGSATACACGKGGSLPAGCRALPAFGGSCGCRLLGCQPESFRSCLLLGVSSAGAPGPWARHWWYPELSFTSL